MRYFLTVLILLNFQAFADSSNEFAIYYLDNKKFSIMGYDIEYEEDLPFEVTLNQTFEVHPKEKMQLADGSYREIINLTIPKTNTSALVQTRITSNTKTATVTEAKELVREANYVTNDFNQGWEGAIKYQVTLNDGSLLEIGRATRGVSHEKPELLSLQVLPGDEIKFISENQGTLDFQKATFEIQLYRNQKHISNLYGLGTARQPKPIHINSPQNYILSETGSFFSWSNGSDYMVALAKTKNGHGSQLLYTPVISFSGLTAFYGILATEQPNGRYPKIPTDFRAGIQFTRKPNTDVFTNSSLKLELPLYPLKDSSGNVIDSREGWKRKQNP